MNALKNPMVITVAIIAAAVAGAYLYSYKESKVTREWIAKSETAMGRMAEICQRVNNGCVENGHRTDDLESKLKSMIESSDRHFKDISEEMESSREAVEDMQSFLQEKDNYSFSRRRREYKPRSAPVERYQSDSDEEFDRKRRTRKEEKKVDREPPRRKKEEDDTMGDVDLLGIGGGESLIDKMNKRR